jgi:hypothetical protein
MARTAVIAGTATAVSNKVTERQYNKAAAKQQQQMADEAAFSNQAEIDQMQAQMQAMQAQQASAAAAPQDLTAKLQQLAELKAAGVLSEEEFAAAKAKLLS